MAEKTSCNTISSTSSPNSNNMVVSRKLRSRKRKYAQVGEELSPDNDSAAAEVAGFHPFRMESFERKEFPEYTPYEDNYVDIRNHILNCWKRSPKHTLQFHQVMRELKPDLEEDAHRIWRYLTVCGYINSGYTTNPNIKIEALSTNNVKSTTIIVIGAGAAGIIAARQLMEFGFRVIVLEARDRVGGRVDTSNFIPGIDLGASIITGFYGNPLTDPFRQLDIKAVKIGERFKTYLRSTGAAIGHDDEFSAEALFNDTLDKASKLKKEVSKDCSLGMFMDEALKLDPTQINRLQPTLDWLYANLEYACASDLSNLSFLHWDQDDEHDFAGEHVLLRDGYASMLRPLAQGLDIIFNSEVCEITYNSNEKAGNRVQIKTTDGRKLKADAALVTLPLGVLKQNTVKFCPSLPIEKQEAIKRLGFGLLNKLVLQFEEPFWDEELDWIGNACDDPNHRSQRGHAYLIWNMFKFCGLPVLVALYAGEAAWEMEKMDPKETVDEVLQILQRIHNLPKPPKPIKSIVTRWSEDVYARGSYSFIGINSTGVDYDTIAAPIDDVIFFAGEATNRYHPATVAGAYETGLREARKIYESYVPRPPISIINMKKRSQRAKKQPNTPSPKKPVSNGIQSNKSNSSSPAQKLKNITSPSTTPADKKRPQTSSAELATRPSKKPKLSTSNGSSSSNNFSSSSLNGKAATGHRKNAMDIDDSISRPLGRSDSNLYYSSLSSSKSNFVDIRRFQMEAAALVAQEIALAMESESTHRNDLVQLISEIVPKFLKLEHRKGNTSIDAEFQFRLKALVASELKKHLSKIKKTD